MGVGPCGVVYARHAACLLVHTGWLLRVRLRGEAQAGEAHRSLCVP